MPRPLRYPRTETRHCEHCGASFEALTYNIRRGWGLFCSDACKYAGRKARPRTGKRQTVRQLQSGEAVPTTTPKRYGSAQGYIRLRWLVAPREYVECYEHRLIAGVVQSEHVHHKNGQRDDNRPENLERLTPTAHAQHHNQISWDVEEAHRLYRDGWSLLPNLAKKYSKDTSVILRAFQRRGLATRPKPGTTSNSPR